MDRWERYNALANRRSGHAGCRQAFDQVVYLGRSEQRPCNLCPPSRRHYAPILPDGEKNIGDFPQIENPHFPRTRTIGCGAELERALRTCRWFLAPRAFAWSGGTG